MGYRGEQTAVIAALLLSQRLPNRGEFKRVTDAEISDTFDLGERIFQEGMRRDELVERQRVIDEGGLFVEKCSACGGDHLLTRNNLSPSQFPQDGSKPPPVPFPREFICAATGKPVEVTGS